MAFFTLPHLVMVDLGSNFRLMVFFWYYICTVFHFFISSRVVEVMAKFKPLLNISNIYFVELHIQCYSQLFT